MNALPPAIALLSNQAAARYGVDPALVRALAWVESRGNPAARSRAGAVGVMQLMPNTAAGLGVRDRLDPADNIDGGVRYLRAQMTRFATAENALAAYNFGPSRVESYMRDGKAFPASVRRYVKSVLDRRAFEEGARPAAARPTLRGATRARRSRQSLCLSSSASPLLPRPACGVALGPSG